MQSSDKQQIEGGFISGGSGYSLLALFMPLTLLIAVVFLAEAFLPFNIPSAFLITSGAISALAASFYCDFMKDAKSSRTTANLRGGIIIFAVFYIAASLSRWEIPWKERLLPGLFNILVSITALYGWNSVIVLKQFFSIRRRFEIYTELYRGEKLQEMLSDDAVLLQYTDEYIVKTRQGYLFQLTLTGFIIFICAIYKIHLPLALYFLLTAVLIGGVCLYGFFEIIRLEQYCAGEGVNISPHDRIRRIFAIVVFSLFCFTAAIFLASDKSFLPVSLITRFLNWLFSQLHPASPVINRTIETENPAPVDSIPNLFDIDRNAPSFIWEQILKYGSIILKYGLIFLVTAGFIRFMISPLLNRGDDPNKLTFRRRLFHIIAEWLKNMSAAIVSFFIYLKNGKNLSKLKKIETEEIHITAKTVLGAYSPEKKRDMYRSVTLFARLIIWGSNVRKVIWKPSIAPGEYCELLVAASPDNEFTLQQRNMEIIRCGELFKKALYSAEVLSGAERKEYKSLVEKITSADK